MVAVRNEQGEEAHLVVRCSAWPWGMCQQAFLMLMSENLRLSDFLGVHTILKALPDRTSRLDITQVQRSL